MKTIGKVRKPRIGRPPLFDSPEALQAKVKEYFESGAPVRTVQIGTGKAAHFEEVRVPTITGLALYLGFVNRQSLYDMEQRPQFSDIVKQARARVEQDYEEWLRGGGNPAGPIFALKNMGWYDRHEITGEDGAPVLPPQVIVQSHPAREMTDKVIAGERTVVMAQGSQN